MKATNTPQSAAPFGAVSPSPAHCESDFVAKLLVMDNSYPDKKRDRLIRDVFGTGAYLRFEPYRNEWNIGISL